MERREVVDRFAAGIVVAFAWHGAAFADPCKAIPDRGPLPSELQHQAQFSGPVVYVGDGDSFCVDVSRGRGSGSSWVEVRLASFYAPELHEPGGGAAKALLARALKGKVASCRAMKRSYDRVVAQCAVEGRDLAAQLRRWGGREGGRGYSLLP